MNYELYDRDGNILDQAELVISPRNEALQQIAALEGQVTQRRMREAALTDEGKVWLAAIEDQIKGLRSKL
jgi:hypothetical protein